MTPIPPIPEDLQAIYRAAISCENGTCIRNLIERIAKLTAANEQKETEWWVRLGKFRKALEAANLHGHYNLFQTHFEDESGKWEALEAENTHLKAPVTDRAETTLALRAYQSALVDYTGFDSSHVGLGAAVDAVIASRATRTPPQEGQ